MTDSTQNSIDQARNGVALVSDLVKAAADSPEGKIAAKNIGKTAVTVTKALNHLLLPVAAFNFVIERAGQYFQRDFQPEMEAKMADIPPDKVVEPKATVAGPALQGLAFAHEEPELKELFLNLLASAMDGRKADTAHPAFVEVLKQLTGEEARLLRGPLTVKGMLPVAQIHAISSASASTSLLHNHVGYTQAADGSLVEIEALAAMVDNWIRLGLVHVTYLTSVTDLDGSDPYGWVEMHPLYKIALAQAHEQGYGVKVVPGSMRPTNFGQLFAIAVGMMD